MRIAVTGKLPSVKSEWPSKDYVDRSGQGGIRSGEHGHDTTTAHRHRMAAAHRRNRVAVTRRLCTRTHAGGAAAVHLVVQRHVADEGVAHDGCGRTRTRPTAHCVMDVG